MVTFDEVYERLSNEHLYEIGCLSRNMEFKKWQPILSLNGILIIVYFNEFYWVRISPVDSSHVTQAMICTET